MKKILVINSGSSTIKADVFAIRNNEPVFLAKALADKIGKADATITLKDPDFSPRVFEIGNADIQAALAKLIQAFATGGICTSDDLAAIGHRVVHGGSLFSSPALITDKVISAIREMSALAPLHNPANLAGIEYCRQHFTAVGEPLDSARDKLRRTVPQVAVFDTAFHQTMPEVATTYAIPRELAQKYGLRRYGFHGTSHEYVTRECARRMQIPYGEFNAISLHLGNGASVCAVLEGKSIDTSLGFTPLEGLVMGTRSGDIDPSLVFFLQNTVGLSAADAESLLNKKSGLLGLADSSDMRDLLARANTGDTVAELAINVFCARARKYIGAFLMHGRPHAIIFTGGIGENAAEVRRRILADLAHLQIELDSGKNAEPPADGLISVANSTTVYVINTDEELMIARSTLALVSH